MLNEKLTVNFEAIFVPSRQASIQASSSVIPLKKIKTSNITEFTMLQPDSVYVLKAHDPVHSVHFQNQQLLVGTKAGRVKIFCLSSLRSNYELKAGTSPIVYLSTNSDNNRLISQERNGVIKLWDLDNHGYSLKHEINTNHIGFTRAQHCVKKNILVTPSGCNDISIIDVESGNESHILKPPEDMKNITSIKLVTWFTGDGGSDADEVYLLAGYESGHLILWDLKTMKMIHQIQFEFPIFTLDFAQCTNRGLVSGPSVQKICVFGIDKAKQQLYHRPSETIELQKHEGSRAAGISCIKIRPDRKCLIVGMSDGIVYIHSWKSLRKLATLKDHRGEICDFAFSNGLVDSFKSPIMAVAASDGNISLWDIYYK